MTDTELRGLSLWQLSASAIAYGAKRIETRKWKAPEKYIGTRVAIHASKTLGPGGLWALQQWMQEEVNRQWLFEAGLLDPGDWSADPAQLPRGAFVCTVTLVSCTPTEELAPFLSDLEWSHGDYTPGRWGWSLTDVRRLEHPLPYGGALGLYRIDPQVQAQIRSEEIQTPVDSDRLHSTPALAGPRPTPRQFSR